jgi:hypothetical protein
VLSVIYKGCSWGTHTGTRRGAQDLSGVLDGGTLGGTRGYSRGTHGVPTMLRVCAPTHRSALRSAARRSACA